MTKEEALNKAINIVVYFEAHFAKSKEARKNAENIIEVLEQEREALNNVIDRQALIDAINTCDTFGFVEPNCFVRNPKGNVVTYLRYDDVIKCIKAEVRISEEENVRYRISN